MRRSSRFASIGVLTLSALCFAGSATPAYATDIVRTATDTAAAATEEARIDVLRDVAPAVQGAVATVDDAVGGVDVGGVGVVDGGGAVPGRGGVRGSVVGYISYNNTTGTPTFAVSGALADPTLWDCTGGPAYAGGPFTVSCKPLPNVVLSWDCDVLHADAYSASDAGLIRTSMDCTGDGVAEARTDTVSGSGVDNDWAVADIPVTVFTCTFDDGAGAAPRGRHGGGCGDPGVPELE